MPETMSNEEIIEAIGEMTVNELATFVEEFKAKFGVEISGPPAIESHSPLPEPAAIEATEFDVILVAVGEKTINVIKEVRELTKPGLREAKEKTTAGTVILAGVNKIGAEAAKRQLEAAGATVAIK